METQRSTEPTAVNPDSPGVGVPDPAGLWGNRLTRHGTRTIAVSTTVLGGLGLLSGATALLVVEESKFASVLLAIAGLAGFAWLGVLCFFRNPTRKIPAFARCVVSPADGRVLSIDEVEEAEYVAGPVVRIQIFLSVLDVHVNRSPVEGVVEYLRYRPGSFRNALRPDARETNESQAMGLRMADGTRVLVRQIAGAIARRIVCPVEPGQRLPRGYDYGMIRFGSQTEVSIPSHSVPSSTGPGCEATLAFRPTIGVGDPVRAGETVLGHWGEGSPA